MTNIAEAEKAKVSSVGYVVLCALVNRLPQKLKLGRHVFIMSCSIVILRNNSEFLCSG